MSETPAVYNGNAELMEAVLVGGDLSRLTPAQRTQYYLKTCETLMLNPFTKPFEYIELNNKLVLYARRDCTDQLRSTRHVNVSIVARELVEGVYTVTARATMPDGRTDESIGAVALAKESGEWKTAQSGKRYFAGNGEWKPLQGEERANAMMKAETKAKRRVTLSICGLGIMDESETSSVPGARVVPVDVSTGEIIEASKVSGNTEPATDAPEQCSASEPLAEQPPDPKPARKGPGPDTTAPNAQVLVQERIGSLIASKKITHTQANELLTKYRDNWDAGLDDLNTKYPAKAA